MPQTQECSLPPPLPVMHTQPLLTLHRTHPPPLARLQGTQNSEETDTPTVNSLAPGALPPPPTSQEVADCLRIFPLTCRVGWLLSLHIGETEARRHRPHTQIFTQPGTKLGAPRPPLLFSAPPPHPQTQACAGVAGLPLSLTGDLQGQSLPQTS